jgi:hypothetical protein
MLERQICRISVTSYYVFSTTIVIILFLWCYESHLIDRFLFTADLMIQLCNVSSDGFHTLKTIALSSFQFGYPVIVGLHLSYCRFLFIFQSALFGLRKKKRKWESVNGWSVEPKWKIRTQIRNIASVTILKQNNNKVWEKQTILGLLTI